MGPGPSLDCKCPRTDGTEKRLPAPIQMLQESWTARSEARSELCSTSLPWRSLILSLTKSFNGQTDPRIRRTDGHLSRLSASYLRELLVKPLGRRCTPACAGR